MDGKLSIGPDSKFRLKKCTTIHHDKADRISQLPDEVIHTILSLLPLREAVATSILSRRWPNLWKHRCNLIFGERSLKLNTRDKMTNLEGILWDAKKCKYIAMVNSVLQSHAALSLKVFAVSFYVNKSAHDVISEWLEFAFSRQVEMLDLDFHCRGGPLLVVLEEILRGSKISPISFKSLKTLCLRSFKVSGEDIKLFLCSCPVLERLILQNTFLTSDVEVSGATLRLNHLDLAESSSSRGSVIRVSAPNLTWLGLDDSSPGKLFLDRNTTPKIVGASLVHCSRNPDVVQRLTSFVSCFISQLKTLSLKIVFPEVFLANRFPELPNLSKLEIKYVGRYQQCIMHVSALIWTFPNLQEFRLKFINIFGTPRVAGVETTTAIRCSRHQHVRVFEFVGFHADTESHKQMVAYMVNSCVALRKVIVGYQPCRLDSSESRHESVTPEVYAEQKLQGLVPNHIQLHLYNHRR